MTFKVGDRVRSPRSIFQFDNFSFEDGVVTSASLGYYDVVWRQNDGRRHERLIMIETELELTPFNLTPEVQL